MNARERVQATLEHRQPDRVPIGMHFAEAASRKLCEKLGVTQPELGEWLGHDFSSVGPKYHHAVSEVRYSDPTIRVNEKGYFVDIYGVPYREARTEFQSYVELAGEPPLAGLQSMEELEAYPWPKASDWDYSGIEKELDAKRDTATTGAGRGFFEISHFVRGMEGFMTDLALEPERACALMDHIAGFLLEKTRRSLEAGRGKYMIYEYNDDVASQRGLMMSPAMWREYFKPRMAKFCRLIHDHGAKVRYHCCGSPYAIMGDLIEIGVDILHPVQPLATDMDPFKLKREFGSKLTFHGAMDTQQLLPTGTADEVRRVTRKMVDVVGKNGGYILAGSHSIQADVPVENVIAMIEEAKR